MSVPATPAAAPTASATPSASTSAASAPSTSKPATSSAPSSPSGKPTPMTANQFRAALRGQQNSPLESAPAHAAASVDELESPLGLDRSEADLDPSLEAQSEELQETNLETEDSEQVSDFSWAEALQDYKDGIHNTPLAELLQALSQGQIPEALWDKLHIPLKDGDYEWSDTLANARNGAMMRAKFTQKMQEFAKERDQFTREKGELVDYLGGWRNDATGIALLKGLKRMGMPFDAMARAYAAEVQQLEEMEARAPGSRALFEEKQRMEQELEELKRRQTREQTQQTENKTSQDTNRIAQAVKNAASKSFEQNALPMTQGSWNVFREHLSALWTASGLDAPTMEMVTEATLATKEFVTQAQQNHTKAITAQAAVKAPLTARAVDSGAARSVPKTSPVKKALTAAEFRKKLALNPFQR